MTHTDNADSPTISRLVLAVPIKAGIVPALTDCSYATRVEQVFATLGAGWASWRGHPWPRAYVNIVQSVPRLQSFRLAVLQPPGRIVLESTFEGERGAHLTSLRGALGPLLDLVFCNSDGYSRALDLSDAQFAEWVLHAQVTGDLPGGAQACAVAELQYLRPVERRCPVAGVNAPLQDSTEFELHALADLYQLRNLFSFSADHRCPHQTACLLMPGLLAKLVATGLELEKPTRQRFTDAIGWLRGDGESNHEIGEPSVAAVTPQFIQIDGKALVTKVLLDVDGNYSVSGYADRMRQSFGLIYLGLDKTDSDYGLQSGAANAAIGLISEEDAFRRAFDNTRATVSALGAPATFTIEELSDAVLSALCVFWFDIPDGQNFIAGGQSLTPPARCPGHFAAPSGYIFQPKPSLGVSIFGKKQGAWLHQAAMNFVRERRTAGKTPQGALSKALFAAFPNSPAQDDLLARTLVGVMIGFLPTVQYNLINTMGEWSKDSTIATLRHEFLTHPEPDPYLRAVAVIRKPLMATMQQVPMPPKVWRTALSDHDLPSTPVVHVKAGDRLSVNIDTATREDLASHIVDVYPIFGGDRSRVPHPTHACPGFQMGMGVLLGIIAGTLDAPPTLVPFSVNAPVAIL